MDHRFRMLALPDNSVVNLDRHSDQTFISRSERGFRRLSGPIKSWLNAEYEDDEARESDEG
jgi:hypothetical protein